MKRRHDAEAERSKAEPRRRASGSASSIIFMLPTSSINSRGSRRWLQLGVRRQSCAHMFIVYGLPYEPHCSGRGK
jgi:hypothetical protein